MEGVLLSLVLILFGAMAISSISGLIPFSLAPLQTQSFNEVIFDLH